MTGLSEDKIAALDKRLGRVHAAAEQSAFDLTRRLTHQPHTLTDDHLAAVSKHYKPLQVLEIIFTVANNNSTNRWTDGMSIPLEKEGAFFARGKPKVPDVLNSFLTPTADKFKTRKEHRRAAGVAGPTRSVHESRSPSKSGSLPQAQAASAACR